MIVEDELMIADDMASKLKRHSIEVTGIHRSGEKALEAIDTDRPDVVIMDIQLDGAVDGISAAKLITARHPVPVIYLTDHVDNKTVERAAKTIPANYLQKPFVESDLVRAVKLAFSNAKKLGKAVGVSADHVFLKINNVQTKVMYDEIYYLEADGAYCKVFTKDKPHVQILSMNHVLEQLNSKVFVRVHRSYAVNIDKVEKVDGNVLTLGNYKVEMSKSMRDDLMVRLNFLK